MTKTAAIYLRCSTEKQVSGSSLERQLRYCRNWCATNDVTYTDIVVDIGSGWDGANLSYHTSTRKGNLGRLLKGYEHGFVQKHDYFLYESGDRLCRDIFLRIDIQRHLRSLGITPEQTVTEPAEDFWTERLPPSEKVAIYQL